MKNSIKDNKIATDLIPHCPICGKEMTVNLRCDDTFVEDDGWHKAKERYLEFIEENKNKKILFLELGGRYEHSNYYQNSIYKNDISV